MRKIIVNEKQNEKKLNNVILDTFQNLNQNQLYKALRKRDIRVNGKKISENIVVHTGDEIAIYIVDELLLGKNIVNIDKVYEDENILIINKPEGISVTKEKETNITITDLVKKEYGNDLEPCHRLDRNTKGLLIYAKNNVALKIMLEKFKNHEIEKHYKATVIGIPKEEHKIIKAYLFKDRKKSMVYISDTPKKDYLEIITEYTVIDKNKSKNLAVVDVILHTGRTHQIRAHFAHMGYPILGDEKYGVHKINKEFGKNKQELCAYKIVFNWKEDSGILEYLKNKVVEI